MQKYMKDYVKETKDGILTAKVWGIGEIQTNKNGKEFRKITFVLPSTQQQVIDSVYLFNFNNGMWKVGDTVEISFNKRTSFLDYRLVQANAETSQPMTQTPREQIQTERTVTASVKMNAYEEDEKGIRIQLNGLFQAFVNGNGAKYNATTEHGKLVDDALCFAVAAREAINKKAAEIHLLGDAKPKKPAPKVTLPDDVQEFYSEEAPQY